MKQELNRRLYWVGSAAVVLAAVLYCSWPLGLWLNPAAAASGLASEFGAFGQPYNWVFIGGDIASGVLLVLACVLLGVLMRATGLMRWCLVLLAVYGVCGALDAALPIHCLPSMQTCGPILHDPLLILHGVFDYLGSVALLGTLVLAWRLAKQAPTKWLPWIYSIGVAGIVFALLSLLFLLVGGPGFWAQRYYLTISSIWVASMPFVLRSIVNSTDTHVDLTN